MNDYLMPSASLCCTLAASASVRVPVADISSLRKLPAPGTSLPISLLKNADEQTVVVVSALLQAISRAGRPIEDYADWAVLASPRLIGRDAIAQAIVDYGKEGVWGVSPHIIPHRSLHSTSGTLTLVLGSKGPNYGIGGGPDGEVEGLLGAFSMLHERPISGVWLALSRVEPLLACDPTTGRPHPNSMVEAVVMGLSLGGTGTQLKLEMGHSGESLDLSALARLLESGGSTTLGRIGRLTAA